MRVSFSLPNELAVIQGGIGMILLNQTQWGLPFGGYATALGAFGFILFMCLNIWYHFEDKFSVTWEGME